jgi:cell division protein DivIC
MIIKLLHIIKRVKFLRVNYFTITLFFLIWMLFFDTNDIITQIRLMSKLNALKKEKNYYKENIIKLKEDIIELSSNEEAIEAFAREKYFMKKKNEHIYFIE